MIEILVSSVLASAVTVLLIAYLGRAWFEARLKASIEHEYKKQFEIFQRKLDQQQKVELVAELLAEMLATPYGETVPREQRTLLNKLSFQASLWLPGELAIELSKRLQNQPDAKTPFELMLIARRLLIADTSIGVEHVTIWDAQLEKQSGPVFHYAKN